MNRAAKRAERTRGAIEGLLPRLVDLLLVERNPLWRPFAVEDLLAVVILQYGMDDEGLDSAAMGAMRGFSRRAGLSLAAPGDCVETRVTAYFEANPLPAALTDAASPVLEAVRLRGHLPRIGTGPADPSLPWVALALAA
ncbi:MAG: hypothetical protein AAFX94_03290 [Myxococcota bacterium]